MFFHFCMCTAVYWRKEDYSYKCFLKSAIWTCVSETTQISSSTAFCISVWHIKSFTLHVSYFGGSRKFSSACTTGWPPSYCHTFVVCVTCETGFRIRWSNSLDLYNLLQHFDWTLSTSDHTTLIHYSWSQSHSLLYSLGSDLAKNTYVS
jgi:hypothetical protein